MKTKSLGAVALLFLAGTGYGSAFIANKVAAESGLPVTAYMFWISALGAFTLELISSLLLAGPKLVHIALDCFLLFLSILPSNLLSSKFLTL